MYIDIEINRMTNLYEISFGLNGFEYDYNVVVRKISKLESAKGYRITHGLSDECCVIVELDDNFQFEITKEEFDQLKSEIESFCKN